MSYQIGIQLLMYFAYLSMLFSGLITLVAYIGVRKELKSNQDVMAFSMLIPLSFTVMFIACCVIGIYYAYSY